MAIEFTDEQKLVIDSVQKDINNRQITIVAGCAGSGKSTCLSYLTELYPDFAVCCYTGKAANVLRNKGVDRAATIHSTIYSLQESENGKLYFRRRPKHKLEYSGFFIDEASMISEDIFSDLVFYNLPLIFVGDHAQLEPINSKFNLMKKPDYVLETVHRNANTIAKFANHIRAGHPPEAFEGFDDLVQIANKKTLLAKTANNFDQIICGYNKSRHEWNSRIRRIRNFKDELHVGETLICLKNNRDLGIFNGMQGTVERIYKDKRILLKTENGDLLKLQIEYGQFHSDKLMESSKDDREVAYLDYGYCITCHKSQGSEWGSVCVIEEKPFRADGWDQKRWAYTAASRAKNKLLWCC
jgi:exodeoxyribonuclease-5